MFGGIFFLSEIDTLKYAIYVLLRLYSLEKKIFCHNKLFSIVLNCVIIKVKLKPLYAKSY